MGSFVVREYMIQFGSEAPDAVVLSGTGWQPPAVCRFGKALAGLVCHISGAQKPSRLLDRIVFSSNNRGFQPAETPYDWLSRDKEVVKRYAEDPYCGFPFTAGGFRDFFRGLLYLTDPKRLAGIPTEVPVLLISGDKDPVGDQGKGVAIVAEQLKAAGVKRVTTRLYPDARHELFNEINREEVIGDLVSWLEGLG
jgi:alpha-beta hydrolase superfamily lysophospholipase